MERIVKGFAGAGMATLLALSAPAFAQDNGQNNGQDAGQEAGQEAQSGAEQDAPAQDAQESNPDGMAAEGAAPSGPSPEIQAMIDGIEGEADQALWCASAFALLASVSENPAEQQGLGQLAQGLVATAREELPEADYSEDDFAAIAAGYNLIVLDQFEAQDETAMPYTPDDCFVAAEVPEAAPGAAPDAPAPGAGMPADGAASPDAMPNAGGAQNEAAEDTASDDAASESTDPSDNADEAQGNDADDAEED